jgi:rhamnosyltransferase subunit B
MKIVLATFGSLGDMHPMNALGIELRRRRHEIVFAAMEAYREKIGALGFEFRPMRPNFVPDDRELARRVMDARAGTELLLREILLPNVRPMYDDLIQAVEGADAFITGEVVFAAKSVAEKTGVPWITTSLAPSSFLSPYDPFVPPTAQWLKHFRFLGSPVYGPMLGAIRRVVHSWLGDYRAFRREIGLSQDHNPVFEGKFSDLLHLALFSKVLGKPQPDWHRPTLQPGFCFYDGRDDLGAIPAGLQEFLDQGEPPIVFTLGSAAVMDARDFFERSAAAAMILKKRAVLLYGSFNEPPKVKNENVVSFGYAPYSQVFPRALIVVHQGGVGTTAQVLRAGVPMLVMPYSHDQPDNAARCERLGVARVISRRGYTIESVARRLKRLLDDPRFKSNALEVKAIINGEGGTVIACDAIEQILRPELKWIP